jgi:hypothetical protein
MRAMVRACDQPGCARVATHVCFLETIGEDNPSRIERRCETHNATPAVIEAWTIEEWSKIDA